MTLTEQFDATTQTLLTRSTIVQWLEEYNPSHEEFQSLLSRLTAVYEEFHSKRKEADIEAMRTLLKAKGISIEELLGKKEPKKKGESATTQKSPIWYVNDSGEKVHGEIGSKGAAPAEMNDFLEYAKGLGITRKQIIEMTEQEWDDKFTPYINKMKK